MSSGPLPRPVRSSRILAQQAQGATVLLSLDEGTYFSLNDVGAVVWEMCDGTHTLAEVVEAVCAEFDAPPDVVTSDVVALVEELASERLVVYPD